MVKHIFDQHSKDISSGGRRPSELEKLLGTWDLQHRDLNTGETWQGRDRFEWLEGGEFFMAHYHEEFNRNIQGVMLIGYERRWGKDESSDLIGHWFESTTGNHFVYVWEMEGKNVTFWLEERDSDAAFRGTFSDDWRTLSGAWTWPGGGYELVMTKM